MQAVLAVMNRPFVWGTADCCTSACDVFLRLWGVDPMQPLRGLYASKDEATAIIRARGGWRRMAQGLADAAGLVGGCGEAGEIGLVRLNDGFALGVALGHGQWAGPVDGGFQTVGPAVLSWAR